MMLTKENFYTLLSCYELLIECTCPRCLHTGLKMTIRVEHKKPFAVHCTGCNVIHEPEILVKEMGKLNC
jgi:hypothetical protein